MRLAVCRDRRGGSAVEYIVLVGLLALIVLGTVRVLGARAREKSIAHAQCVADLSCPDDPEMLADGFAKAAPLASPEVGHVAVRARKVSPVTSLAVTTAADVPAVGGVQTSLLPDPGNTATVTITVGGEQVEASVAVSDVYLTADGEEFVDVTVTISVDQVRGGALDLGRLGVSAEAAIGTEITFVMSVPVEDGRVVMPDMLDPHSWPVGTQVMLRLDAETSLDLGAEYGVLGIDTGYDSTQGAAIAFIKTSEDQVLVVFGQTEAVEAELAVGLRLGVVSVDVTASRRLDTYTLRFVEIDLDDASASEMLRGALAAALVGKIAAPPPGSGVRTGTMIQSTYSAANAVAIEADLGHFGFSAEHVIGGLTVDVTEMRYDDGEVVTATTIRDTASGSTAVVVRENGEVVSVDVWWRDVDAATAALFDANFNGDYSEHDGNYTLHYTATEQEVLAFRDDMAQICSMPCPVPSGRYARAETAEVIAAELVLHAPGNFISDAVSAAQNNQGRNFAIIESRGRVEVIDADADDDDADDDD